MKSRGSWLGAYQNPFWLGLAYYSPKRLQGLKNPALVLKWIQPSRQFGMAWETLQGSDQLRVAEARVQERQQLRALHVQAYWAHYHGGWQQLWNHRNSELWGPNLKCTGAVRAANHAVGLGWALPASMRWIQIEHQRHMGRCQCCLK